MNLHQKILGIPFVYDKVRPWVLGGIDVSDFYAQAELRPDDVVLDLGCGTGNALVYLKTFARYAGFDTDPLAISAAQRNFSERAEVSFTCKECTASDVVALAPSVVIMNGLLHHLPNGVALELLGLARNAPSVRRILTLDIVYLPGREHWVSNAFAALDRGRFCRKPQGYRDLAARAELLLLKDTLIWNDPKRRRARYFSMLLEPGRAR